VLVPQRFLRQADWVRRTIEVALTRDQIHGSPRYAPGVLNREDEQSLDAHYR
jgi:hypothetical protein